MPNSATAGGFLLVLAIVLPVMGVLLSLALGGRHAERIALTLMPAGLAVAVAIAAAVWRTHNVLQYFVGGWDPPLGVAFRADGLSAAMIVTAALLICGIGLFARAQFPSAARRGNACAAGVLDIAAGGLGSAQRRLYRRRPVQPLCRPRTADFRRGAVGLPRRPCGDTRGRVALPAVRAARLNPLSARHCAALWRLRHPRYRSVVRPHPCGACGVGRDLADDGRAAGQGRTLPVPFMAAARPCRRSRPGQRHTVGAGRQGAFLSRRPAVVRRHAEAAGAGGGAGARHPWAPRQSCSAACWRCGRCG